VGTVEIDDECKRAFREFDEEDRRIEAKTKRDEWIAWWAIFGIKSLVVGLAAAFVWFVVSLASKPDPIGQRISRLEYERDYAEARAKRSRIAELEARIELSHCRGRLDMRLVTEYQEATRETKKPGVAYRFLKALVGPR
jgi:hypothetical protein